MTAVRALEFYSGIGGLHIALKRSGVNAHVVSAFEWDQSACRVYGANYGRGIVNKVDISRLNADDLIALDASLWLMSPSCQPYTVLNPRAKGETDPRARSFLHLIENVLPELCRQKRGPRWILIENVAGFETSTTRQTLMKQLHDLGYTAQEFLLTPLQYGIPNSRLRYYCLAKAQPLVFPHYSSAETGKQVMRFIPRHGEPWVDRRDDLEMATDIAELRVYLDADLDPLTHSSWLVPDRVLEKWGRLFDIVLPSSRRTCCFTRGYTQLVERAGSILQLNESLETADTFNTFLRQQMNPSQSTQFPIEVLRPLRLRYFTPTELLRIFHFLPPDRDEKFVWPEGISEKTKYRMLGNSINVEVVRRLIEYLFEGGDDL